MKRDIENTWEEFYQNELYGNYYNKIQSIATKYPEEKSLLVDFHHLDRNNPDFAERFLNNPRKYIEHGENALRNLIPEDIDSAYEKSVKPKDMEINLRVYNLPVTSHYNIMDLRSEHLEQYLAIDGMVQTRSEIRPRMYMAVYKCARCEFQMVVYQDEITLTEPLVCANENCGRTTGQTSFILQKQSSGYFDLQIINVQENPEAFKGSAPPQHLRVFARSDLCGKVVPGERLTINGVLFASQKRINDKKSVDFDLFLDAYSIEQETSPYEDIEITDEEEKEILALSKNPNIYDLIRESIAPGIFDVDIIKDAISLQMFGGVTKDNDIERTRGDIHILLLGDPSCGKSQLLRYTSVITPRGVPVTAKTASQAGLIGAAIKDEYDGKWTLAGGALVNADHGHVSLDEADKMSGPDRDALHPAMEQQMVPYQKADIKAILYTRCSILAAANPKKGRFDLQKSYVDQITLSPTLLSRFDLIFPMVDRADKDKDGMLSLKVIKRHRAGQMLTSRYQGKSTYSDDDIESIIKTKTAIDIELLQKYIAYSKRTIFPVMNDEVEAYLSRYYTDRRAEGIRDDSDEESIDRLTISIRQLEGLIRLSEASARLRLSQIVEVSDAKRAIKLFDHYISGMARDGDKFDIDIIMVGSSARERVNSRNISKIIKELHSDIDVDTDKGAHIQDIKDRAQSKKMVGNDVEEVIEKMSLNGEVFSPDAGTHWKLTR